MAISAALTDTQIDNILFILGGLIAVFKAIDIYLRNQQTQAVHRQADAQDATTQALIGMKKEK